jgi:hypothetical protein
LLSTPRPCGPNSARAPGTNPAGVRRDMWCFVTCGVFRPGERRVTGRQAPCCCGFAPAVPRDRSAAAPFRPTSATFMTTGFDICLDVIRHTAAVASPTLPDSHGRAAQFGKPAAYPRYGAPPAVPGSDVVRPRCRARQEGR